MSLLLYQIFNETNHTKDWLTFANQIVMTGRQTKFDILRSNNYKIGMNILANKLYAIKQKIDLVVFNLSYGLFKRKMKILFKPNES